MAAFADDSHSERDLTASSMPVQQRRRGAADANPVRPVSRLSVLERQAEPVQQRLGVAAGLVDSL